MTSAITAAYIIGGSAVISAGASVYSSNKAAKGAKAAADAEREERALLMERLTGAALDAKGEIGAIADEYKAEVGAAVGSFRKISLDLADKFSYTPVGGILDPGIDGKTPFDTIFDLYTKSDDDRRKRVLGDSEPAIRQALEKFSAMGAGDFSGFLAELRSSEAAIAANTRGGAIGQFANIAAQNRINFMREGVDTSMSIAGLLSSFETQTPTIFQSALQLTDETRREAERKDTTERLKIATKLDVEKSTLSARVGAAAAFASLNVGAATSLANALSGAAQAGFNGSGGAGIAEALQGQAAAGVAKAVGDGVSNYVKYQQSEKTNARLDKMIAKQGE